jgi:hypothetical protein
MRSSPAFATRRSPRPCWSTIGTGTKSASTRYSLFTAAGNAAIAYVGLVDSRFEKPHGVAGVGGSDAALDSIGVVILGFGFWQLGSFGKTKHIPTPPDQG